jgi:transcriptional regulator GlxA family with amidase domain
MQRIGLVVLPDFQPIYLAASSAFHTETGQSPAKAVENLRLEAVRLMMEQSRHLVELVATETGFADPERMRRAFIRAFGQPPQVIRRNARVEATV